MGKENKLAIQGHVDYPSRWGVLWTVFLLNIANNALWISFSSVATTSASYYEKSIDDIDWLGSIGFIVGVPMCLISTWVVDRFGLRTAIFIGTFLTFMGGLVRETLTFRKIFLTIKHAMNYFCFKYEIDSLNLLKKLIGIPKKKCNYSFIWIVK